MTVKVKEIVCEYTIPDILRSLQVTNFKLNLIWYCIL